MLHKIFSIFIPILFRKLESYKKSFTEERKVKLTSKLQSVGFGFKLNGDTFIIRSPEKIVIGNNVHIGNNIFIAGEGGLIIKDNTHISRNVTIYTVNHNYQGDALPYDNSTTYKPVIIGKNVWIGMNVSILPGTVIKDGAIIGMGTVVNRRIEQNEIVGNTSLSNIRNRNGEHYFTLETNKKYGGVNGKLLDQRDIEKFKPSYALNRKKEIIFILSIGRSGSKSIVEILNQNPKNSAFHEDIRQLIRISTELAYNQSAKDKCYQQLEEIFSTKIWQAEDNQVLIHSDQRLWNFIQFLKDYFPHSKFIHLKREPFSCIKSMVARGWYIDAEYPCQFQHDWAKFRLQGDRVGAFTKNEWDELNQIQKCSWYWCYINHCITKDLSQLPKSRTLELDITNIGDKLNLLSRFVNSDDFKLSNHKSNEVRVKDVFKYEQLGNGKIDSEILDFLKEFNHKYN